nr:hypothetical protein I308_05756 [Cryptococcus tetragattii IND107]
MLKIDGLVAEYIHQYQDKKDRARTEGARLGSIKHQAPSIFLVPFEIGEMLTRDGRKVLAIGKSTEKKEAASDDRDWIHRKEAHKR